MAKIVARLSAVAAFAISALGLGGTAQANVIFTVSGSTAGNNVSASADFAISGTNLTITLKNTSPANSQEAPGSTLTGLNFLLNGNAPTLNPLSATSPNAIFNAAACDANACSGMNVNIGGEFGYENAGGVEAIGGAGYITTGLTGDLGNFGGVNLENPVSLDGINFGIISATHGGLNGGNGGLATVALVDDTAVFELNNLPSGLTEADIGSVNFLYGTAPDAVLGGSCTTNCGSTPPGGGGGAPPPVPEPATALLFGLGILGLGLVRRRVLAEAD